MAYSNDHIITFGDVIAGTLDVVQRHLAKIALYVGVFSAIGFVVTAGLPFLISTYGQSTDWTTLLGSFFGFGAGIGGLIIFIVAVIGQYLLWEGMLADEGFQVNRDNRRYLAFFGQSLLIALAIGIGYVLLIIPGLIFTARFAMAPAILIANERKLTDAMGSSWDTISGNTTPIALVIFVAALGTMMLSGVIGYASVSTEMLNPISYFSIAAEQVISHFTTALVVALGVYLYGEMYGDRTGVTEVFT